ncbi:L-idonate 5-dehydrogenase [Rhodobacteraceae bacterium CCMM004]|nr:L-idonate 5-dehydrogenase [Rhodobacteraceae bacterium CCMM004]
MKSVVLHAPRDLRLEESAPPPPGPGEVAVRLAAGGICGSDLHYYAHGGFGTVRLREPMILGHEVAGHVAALGDGVTGLSVGQLVAVSPSRPCRACRYCHEGRPNQCLNMRFYGSAMPFPHIQGAFRQVLVADARQCADAEGLSPAQAALAEPLAVCLHAAGQAGPLLGRRVLVTGCGPIGLLCVLVARAAGAAEIVATDLTAFTLALAADRGADRTLNMAEAPQALGPYAADKGYFDVQFECTGAAPALAAGIAALRPGGTVVQVGLGGDMTVPVQSLTAKELSLRGAFRFHDEFFVGVDMMRSGRIDPAPLVTQTVPLARAAEGFDLAGDRSQAMKVQIEF